MLKTFSRVQMLSIGEEVARKASESGFVLKLHGQFSGLNPLAIPFCPTESFSSDDGSDWGSNPIGVRTGVLRRCSPSITQSFRSLGGASIDPFGFSDSSVSPIQSSDENGVPRKQLSAGEVEVFNGAKIHSLAVDDDSSDPSFSEDDIGIMDESSTGDESEVVLGQLNGPIPGKAWRLNGRVRRLIVFAPSRWTVKRMWHELARLGNVTEDIRKIEKSRYKKGPPMFSLYVLKEVATCAFVKRMKRWLKSSSKRCNCYWSVPYFQRKKRRGRAGRANDRVEISDVIDDSVEVDGDSGDGEDVGDVSMSINVATFNINSIIHKRKEVARLLAQRKWDVLALQETRLGARKWPFSTLGFKVFRQSVSANPRGLALLVNNDLAPTLVQSHGSQHHMWCSLTLKGIPTPVYVCAVYAPHVIEARSDLLEQLKREISELKESPMWLMGDWNPGRHGPLGWARRLGMGIRSMEWSKGNVNQLTFRKGTREVSQLDGILMNEKLRDMLAGVNHQHALNWCCISDHYPVEARLSIKLFQGMEDEEWRPRTRPKKWLDASLLRNIPTLTRWAKSNHWEAIRNCEDVNEMGEAFISAARATAVEEELLLKVNGNRNKKVMLRSSLPSLSAPARHAIAKRRRVYRLMIRDRSQATITAWHVICRKASSLVKASVAKEFEGECAKVRAALVEGDNVVLWKLLSRNFGLKCQMDVALGNGVKDADGYIHLGPRAHELVLEHFQKLIGEAPQVPINPVGVVAAGADGGDDPDSDDSDSYPEDDNEDDCEVGGDRVDLEVLNADFTAQELLDTMGKLGSNKASGVDGIPYEALKLGEVDDVEQTEEFKSILFMINEVWNKSEVPAAWKLSLINPLPKSGKDPSIPSCTRGIYLNACIGKFMTKMVGNRLSGELERCQLLKVEQGGFRGSQEAVGHVAALYEICIRRKILGLDTFLLFLDVAKAYDSVPHEPLLGKLRAKGVRGKMIRFIRALYADNEACVAVGNETTEVFAVKRGLRQGCPLSTTLFDVYVDGMLDACRHVVTVPGLSDGIAGLQFADDTTLITTTRQEMMENSADVKSWCDVEGLKLGPSKYHAMVMLAVDSDPMPAQLVIEGYTLDYEPSVRYLGIHISSDLSWTHEIERRKETTRKVIGKNCCFLYSLRVPLEARVRAFKAFVWPFVTWGIELWGVNTSLFKTLQSMVNNCLKRILGVPQSTSNLIVWKECNVPSIHAFAIAAQARALYKWYGLPHCLVANLLHSALEEPRCWVVRKRTWATGVKERLTRSAKVVDRDGVLPPMTKVEATAQGLAKHMRGLVLQGVCRQLEGRREPTFRILNNVVNAVRPLAIDPSISDAAMAEGDSDADVVNGDMDVDREAENPLYDSHISEEPSSDEEAENLLYGSHISEEPSSDEEEVSNEVVGGTLVTKAWEQFVESTFDKVPLYRVVRDCFGPCKWMAKLRSLSLWPPLADFPIVQSAFGGRNLPRCWFCETGVPETAGHLLFYCSRWRGPRERLLGECMPLLQVMSSEVMSRWALGAPLQQQVAAPAATQGKLIEGVRAFLEIVGPMRVSATANTNLYTAPSD